MKHRHTFFILALFGGLISLSGCQNNSTAASSLQPTAEAVPDTAAQDPATLRIAARQGNVSKGLLLAADRWEAQTGVHVIVDELAYNYLQEQIFIDVQRQISLYDIVLIDDPWVPSLAGNDYLVPLSAFGYEIERDFLPKSLALGMWPPPSGPLNPILGPTEQPQLYALPVVGNVQMFWYRNDLIATPTDLDSLIESVAAAADDSAGLYAYAYTGGAGNPIVTEFNAWNWSYGGDIFDEDWRVIVDAPASVQALNQMISLTDQSLPASANFRSSREAGLAVLNNQAIASIIWPSHVADISQGQVPTNMTLRPFPSQIAQAGQLGHWLLAIPVTAAHKQEAYNFIRWATSAEMMKAAVYEGVAPTRHSVFADPDLVARYPWLTVTEEAIQNARWRPRTPEWPNVEYVLGTYLKQAVDGQLTAQEALSQAKEEIERLMDEAGYYDS